VLFVVLTADDQSVGAVSGTSRYRGREQTIGNPVRQFLKSAAAGGHHAEPGEERPHVGA